jgi:folylpolyglutamate synthase
MNHTERWQQEDLTRLNIVHVAGTKGKGSTCAYVDSILAQYRKSQGFPKVGLFTSPHLIAVRERIRINSIPIAADLFAKYFFEVWDRLSAAGVEHKPGYFRYLTLMSFHAFIQEKVNIAIYEVGVGGEYDSTNIADSPAVTGISALGIDHTHILGDTIDKIAWNKAGIQKPGVESFTIKQPAEAMEVIKARAVERNVKSLTVLDQDPRLGGVGIKPDAAFQKGNASLAIALAEVALQKVNMKSGNSSTGFSKEFVDGLGTMVIRGRCETKKDGSITWYLDGAHTDDSIKVASKWFSDESSRV